MSGPNVCLICNASCVSIRNSIHIFNENGVSNDLNVPEVLGNLLETEITDESIHSQFLCKKCYKLLDEYDEVVSRLSEIKNEIVENYQNTLEKRQQPEEPVQASSKHQQQLPSRGKVALKGNELPEKILDIPSSDDDDSQSLDEIEMVLVQVQGNEEVADMDMDGDQTFPSFPNSDSEDMQALPTDDVEIGKVKLEPHSKEEPSSNDSSANSSTKPNILKRKPQQNSICYSDNIIIQQPLDRGKKFDDNLNAPIVTRENNLYTCLMCTGNETVAGEAKAIILHMRQAHAARLYICDICGQDFRRRNFLSAHVDEHVATEEGDFQCEVCHRIFNNLRLFRIHRRMHLPQAKAWACQDCGKKYSSKNLLEEHLNVHLGVRPHVCSTCGKDFASKYTFKAHEKTHEMRPRPFKCDRCDKTFLNQHNLTQHEKTHTGIKDYQCHLCNKQFGSSHNLEDCGKCFKRRRLLDYHLKAAHTGERPYKCDICEATFVYPEHFKKHRRIHTGEKPYMCEVCGKAFNSRDNRNAHRFVHSDKKPYECLDCGVGFMRKPLLFQHMKAFGHLNDTIVVNQPRLTLDADISMDAESHLVTVEEEEEVTETKIFIGEDGDDSNEHDIVINERKVTFAEDCSENEGTSQGIEQDVGTEDGIYEEILSTEALATNETQILQTPDGPIQLVKVRIANENGEEEETWIKIFAE
ncbi:hypothetical protein HUJ04_008320 [Dendroctonus ponderosae]|nr:hypothetical protein HUJ04_008320 [Dendroctonus ponderosae]